MKLIKSLVILIISGHLFCIGQVINAQDYNEEVTIIGSYNPTIMDAYKINFSPKILQPEYALPTLNYNISSTRINTNIELEPIKPAKVDGEPAPKLKRNFLKAGYGNYNTPYFEFIVNSLRNKESQFGLHLKHQSSTAKVSDDYGKSNYSHNAAHLFGKRFFKRSTLSANIDYSRDMVYYYGYRDTLEVPPGEEALKQRYQLFGGHINLGSNQDDEEDFGYFMGLGVSYFDNKNQTSETHTQINAGLSKGFEVFNKQVSTLGLQTQLDYYVNDDTMANTNDGVLKLNPYFDMNLGQYQLRLGLTAAAGLSDKSEVLVYPDVEARLHILPQSLTAFAGFTGNMEKAGFRRLSEENPFIKPIVPLRYEKNKLEVYGGITGNLEHAFGFTIKISSASYENMPFFITDTLNHLNNRFTVIYDKTTRTQANIELGYQFAEKWGVSLHILYQQFKTDSLAQPLYKPDYHVDFGFKYHFSNKLALKANLIAAGKQYAMLYKQNSSTLFYDQLEELELDAYMDINLGAEYFFTGNFSLFAQVNNLTSQQYQRWYNYPVQKMNFLAGLTYSF